MKSKAYVIEVGESFVTPTARRSKFLHRARLFETKEQAEAELLARNQNGRVRDLDEVLHEQLEDLRAKATPRRKIVKLYYDQDMESPCEFGDGNWTLYSFGRRHASYKNPDEFFPPDDALRAKLDSGLAFFLSYFEHGQCVWSLRGEGPKCDWDSVDVAGLLVWENDPDDMGAKTPEDREKDAAAFLETYTAWCNGEVYGYVVQDDEGETIDSCFGFYGNDIEYMASKVRANIEEGDEVLIGGDAKDLADFYDFGQRKKGAR